MTSHLWETIKKEFSRKSKQEISCKVDEIIELIGYYQLIKSFVDNQPKIRIIKLNNIKKRNIIDTKRCYVIYNELFII